MYKCTHAQKYKITKKTNFVLRVLHAPAYWSGGGTPTRKLTTQPRKWVERGARFLIDDGVGDGDVDGGGDGGGDGGRRWV